MKNPPCICLDVFTDAALGRIDRDSWIVEYEQHVLDGHVASCHHRSPPPVTHAGEPAREHRIFARILNDLLTYTDEMTITWTR
ncbi:MAG TPA: hypothetical protein VN706_21600 [Gemmatimonadaceae bacterium]|nr:hypothetical protein [Gemmatimonadaceae bacterium]